ncbi:MAG: hypothetical protein ACFFA7_10685 [Promethearchaeota archaeon]
MASVFSWIKKEIGYIFSSLSQIIKALLLVGFASSGLGCAIFLRYIGYNGTIITFVSIIVEFIALVLCYFLIRGYLKTANEKEPSASKGKKL